MGSGSLRWSQHNDTVYFSRHTPRMCILSESVRHLVDRCVVVCVCCLYFKKRGYASSSSSSFFTPFGMIPLSASLFAFSSAGVGATMPQEVANPFERPSLARCWSTVLFVTETFDDFIVHFLTSIHRSSSMTKLLRLVSSCSGLHAFMPRS